MDKGMSRVKMILLPSEDLIVFAFLLWVLKPKATILSRLPHVALCSASFSEYRSNPTVNTAAGMCQ